jgi:squalene-hopene/tetraprenyl-beta-curcumene cyclase
LAALRPTSRDGRVVERIEAAASLGVGWLLDLQNSDGGWPTFCRGWAKLPFDRSGADLTAHALRALKAWQASRRIAAAIERGFAYLEREQRADGSWIPLWFGNQDHPREENPVYGTARVLLAYGDFGRLASRPAQAALSWLAARQNAEGGWGGSLAWKNGRGCGKSSVEETALAVEALLAAADARELQGPIERGLAWIVEAVEGGRHGETSPLGFYFAKLWYYESLYPLIFTVAALGRAAASRAGRSVPLEIAAARKVVPTANACQATDSCPTTLR